MTTEARRLRQPSIHFGSVSAELHPHPEVAYPCWTGFAVQCPVCGEHWFYSSPGDFLHQQTAHMVRQARCPAHGGTLEELLSLSWYGEHPIISILGRVPHAILVSLVMWS